MDVSAVDVVARRKTGLEEQYRRPGLGQHQSITLDAHETMGAQRVDPDVGVAWVHEDFLILLVPRVQGVPREAHGVGQLACILGVKRGGGGSTVVADEEVAAVRTVRDVVRPGKQVLGHVGDRDVELWVAGVLPHVERSRGVEDDLLADDAAHPAGAGFDPASLGGHHGVVRPLSSASAHFADRLRIAWDEHRRVVPRSAPSRGRRGPGALGGEATVSHERCSTIRLSTWSVSRLRWRSYLPRAMDFRVVASAVTIWWFQQTDVLGAA